MFLHSIYLLLNADGYVAYWGLEGEISHPELIEFEPTQRFDYIHFTQHYRTYQFKNGELKCDVELLQNRVNEAAKATQIDAINTQFNDAVNALKSRYPQGEVETWEIQEREATAYFADNDATVPFITKLAEADGVTLTAKAQSILEKATEYQSELAALVAERHQKMNELGG